MKSEQARELQGDMEKIAERLLRSHVSPDDVAFVARTLAEVLAHIAADLEARSRVPRKK